MKCSRMVKSRQAEKNREGNDKRTGGWEDFRKKRRRNDEEED